MEGKKISHLPLIITFSILLLFWWSLKSLDVEITSLFSIEGLGQMVLYFSGLFPPDLSIEFLKEVFAGTIETIAVSVMGTLFAVVTALFLTPLATLNLTSSGGPNFRDKSFHSFRFRGYVRFISRLILNILRSIPELLWAMVFILLVGLGPFAGVLALGVHTGGVLGKLYSDVLENVDPGPSEALSSTGAEGLKVFFYGILPQALPQCVSYTLYRWEMNIRAATIIGFVGAGGIGLLFYKSISLFHNDRVLTLILAVFIMVNLVDTMSLLLRKKYYKQKPLKKP